MSLTFLVGPAGVGKTTIWEYLARNHELIPFKTCTTRNPRAKELTKDHIPQYHFFTTEEFTKKIEEDYFFEYVEHVGNFYGTSKLDIQSAIEDERDWIAVVEIRGAIAIKEKFPQVLTVFIHAPSSEELAKRILERGSETTQQMAERISIAYNREIPNASRLDENITNHTIEQSSLDILKLIEKNHK